MPVRFRHGDVKDILDPHENKRGATNILPYLWSMDYGTTHMLAFSGKNR